MSFLELCTDNFARTNALSLAHIMGKSGKFLFGVKRVLILQRY